MRELNWLSSTAPAIERFRVLIRLGAHEVRVGRCREALPHLTEAHQLLPQVDSQLPDEIVDSVLFTLALANLRVAETENCVHCRNGESCIFPITARGVHTQQEGSRAALGYLAELLERNPQHLTGRWLLNVASMTVGEYPDSVPENLLIPSKAFETEQAFPQLNNVSAQVGLDTLSLSGGAIVDDFDGDHDLDVIVSSWDTAADLRFYRNDADGTFRDVSISAGLKGLYGGLNLLQADYDNDDDLDVLVLRGAWLGRQGRYPNSLLQNDGNGRFRDVTFDAGLANVSFPTQTASWADYDNDGDLDLYVGNEGFPDQLFQNDGRGRFVDVAAAAGINNPSMTKGVVWGDFDNDRFPDVYVSNLNGANKLYHNRQDGTFLDAAVEAGVQLPRASFPTWFWDFNNDGALDLYVASYNATVGDLAAEYLGLPHSAEPDRLYQGDGNGKFLEVAERCNLPRVTQPMGANFGDLNGDGFLDVYLGTGDVPFEALMPNQLLCNDQGRTFRNVTTASGTGHLQKGHGVSFADIDNDGDQDLFIELGGALRGDEFQNALFENPGFGSHWISVQLVGRESNRSAIGARIRVRVDHEGKPREIYRWVSSGGSFGANPLRQQIGVGTAEQIQQLEIYWPKSDRRQIFEDVAVDQFIMITEGQTSLHTLNAPSFSLGGDLEESH